MKRLAFLGALVLSTSLMAAPMVLNQEEEFVKCLELDIPDEAKTDNIFISWKLVGDWDKFDYQFSQGTLDNDVFTIKASEYQAVVDGKKGITLTAKGKPKTDQGLYNLSLKLYNYSEEVEIPNGLDLNMEVDYQLPPPEPIWKTLLKYGIILLALGLITWLVLNATAKFPKGLLQLGTNEVSLKGKKKVSVNKELADMGVFLEDGVDVVFDKKRFGAFQGPRIKSMSNCSLECNGEYIANGTIILPDEEIHGLVDAKGEEILIRFC